MLELGSWSLILMTIFNCILVPSVVVGWFIWRRLIATGVNATRVEVFRNTSGSPSSTVDNVDNNDRARRNGQGFQTRSLQQGNRTDGNRIEVQSQRTNIACLVEVPRGGENQQLASRVKNENRVFPGTSREANLWSDTTTPMPTDCSQIQRQPARQTGQQPSPLNKQ